MKRQFILVLTILTIPLIYVASLLVANELYVFLYFPALVAFGGGESNWFVELTPYIGFFGPILAMLVGALVSVRLVRRILPLWLKILMFIVFIPSFVIPHYVRIQRENRQLEESRKDAERHDGENIRYYEGTKQPMLNERYLNGVPHGKHEYFYENGQFETVKYYANGKLHGIEIDYYEDGELRCVSEHDMGKPVGRHYCLYEDGNLKNEFFYENGLQVNKILYNPDGSIKQ